MFPLPHSSKKKTSLTMVNNTHIYLADDDDDDRLFLEEAFNELYPDVTIAAFDNGQSVIDDLEGKAQIQQPAIIVLDCNMPALTGLEVLKHLQAQEAYKHIQKVMWSVSDKPQTIEECIHHGAIDYYKKPVDIAGYRKIAANLFFLMTKRLA